MNRLNIKIGKESSDGDMEWITKSTIEMYSRFFVKTVQEIYYISSTISSTFLVNYILTRGGGSL